jgi:hypothetical protein
MRSGLLRERLLTFRDTNILCLTASVTAGHVRVSEESCVASAVHELLKPVVALSGGRQLPRMKSGVRRVVSAIAHGRELLLAEFALSARNLE